MRARFYVLYGFVGLLLVATQGQTQYPGGKSGKSGKSGMWGMDPNQMFDKMANGKEVWIRAEITDPGMLAMFDRSAERRGITNGQITRQQFVEGFGMSRRSEGGAPSGGPPAAPGAAPPAGASAVDPVDQAAESSFRRHDLNGDGVLNYDEMSSSLRAERERWDTNRDGFIDLNEYKAYFRARMEQRSADRGGSGYGQVPPPEGSVPPGMVAPPPPEEEESRPVVYRAGKLPKELPAWFQQLDDNNDGQVSLYEWRKNSGRSLEEFEAMDRNNDGFLTAEEVLRYEAQRKDRLAKAPGRPPSGSPGLANSFAGPGSATEGRPTGSEGRGPGGSRGPKGSRGNR